MALLVSRWVARVLPQRFSESIQPRKGPTVVRAIIGLLIVVAIVLVLLKVAVAGGILGLIAIVLLILLLLGRL